MLAPYPFEDQADAWTPELVMERMVEAFETLRRVPASVGPKAFGNGWPAVIHDLADMIHWEPGKEPRRLPPSLAQITRMEEALAWPSQFLADQPLAADALNLWAMCKAWGRSIDGVLQGRAKEAAEIARVVEREINQRRGIERQQTAGDVAAWANLKLAAADGERVERIRANAVIRLERELAKKGLVHAVVIVKPAECSPDKVISRTSLDRWRFVGARQVADKLGRL
ncbi:DUF6362 family protein [Labrys neptuniae]